MTSGFVVVVLLCCLTAASQFLKSWTEVKLATADSFRGELQRINLASEERQERVSRFEQAMSIAETEPAKAIEILEQLAAESETFALLYNLGLLRSRTGNTEKARDHIRRARQLASGRSLLDSVRVEVLAEKSEGPGECSLVGRHKEFPEGGRSFEQASRVSPGLYAWSRPLGRNQYEYFKIPVKTCQRLVVKFRTPNGGGYAGATIHGADGGNVESEVIIGDRSAVREIGHLPPNGADLFITIGNEYEKNAPGSVYRICILNDPLEP